MQVDDGDAGSRPIEASRPVVMVANAENALFALLDRWLAEIGCIVIRESSQCSEHANRPRLLIVDIAFPREGGLQMLKQLSDRHPLVPVVVLSGTFLPGTKPGGTVAKKLGAAAVLPTPVSREVLISTVRQLLSV